MSHDLRLSGIRPLKTAEFKCRLQETFSEILGLSVPIPLVLKIVTAGVASLTVCDVMGGADELYLLGLHEGPDLVRLGMFTEVDENWESFPGPATRASIEVPFGGSAVAFMLAMAAAVTIAFEADGLICDDSGRWAGKTTEALRPQQLLDLEDASWRRKWLAAAISEITKFA